MSVARWTSAHRRSILFLLALTVCAGLASIWRLPVGLFPQVSFPMIRVNLEAGDRPATRMAHEVTWPVERAMREVLGVIGVRSETSRGSAEVTIRFAWGEDMPIRMLEVESAIHHLQSTLPSGTTFRVRRMDTTVYPVLAYSMTSDVHTQVELRDIALYQIQPVLSAVRGVARVGILGGRQEEYRVTVDPRLLSSLGLSFDEVTKALSAANVITAVGRIEDHYKLYLVISDTRFADLSSLHKTVIRSGADGVVRLGDVATVSRETVPQWTRVTANGHEAVLIQIYQQPGGNTVEIARQLKAVLATYRGKLPPGISIANWYDQSALIMASAASVRDAILVGALLAALILLFFLRNLKITLIAVLAVPCVLAATVLILDIFQMSFNIMTLGGMAAAVGLIIDDTIVMMEHLIRRLRSGSGERRLMDAAREFTRPLAGSSASTIVLFLPLAFLSGVTGAFFKPLSLTMAMSLLISFLVVWLVEPLVADSLLGPGDAVQRNRGVMADRILCGYESLMRRLFTRPWLVLLLIFPLLLGGLWGYRHLGSGFMPTMDEGGFVLDYRTPSGTSLTETDRILRQVEAVLQETPGVATYSRRTGVSLGSDLTEANEGDFFVSLTPFPRKAIWSVMDEVRSRIERLIPGIHIEMAQLMEDLIGDLTSVPQPVEIKLFSDDEALLEKTASAVGRAMATIAGVVEVKNGIVRSGDAMDIEIDRVRASREGADPQALTKALSEVLSGTVTTQVERGPKMVGVRVWVPQEDRESVRSVEQLQLRAPDGHLFPLKRIATVTLVTGQPQIMRDNLKRMIAVTGRISGRDMGSVVHDVKGVLQRPGLIPESLYYSLGGLYEQQQIAFRGLMAVFAAVVLLMFLLLLFLYERFRIAFCLLATTLVASSAVFIGLWITRTELNISSMMGMTMIVGIVTEVGIFYTSEYLELPANSDPVASLITAGKNRMRPIAMTTLAAILALLPLAFAIGQGAAMQQPLAIAIISGLIVQFPLVLVLLPILLRLMRCTKAADFDSSGPDGHLTSL